MSRRLKLDVPPPPVLVEGDARVQALQIARPEPERAEEYVSEISRLWNPGTEVRSWRLAAY